MKPLFCKYTESMIVTIRVANETAKLALAIRPRAEYAKPKPMIAATEPVTMGGRIISNLSFPTPRMTKPITMFNKPVTTIPACIVLITSFGTGTPN